MNLGKRVSYLQGLIEGLELDKSTKEGKIIALMVEIMDDMALVAEDLQDQVDEIVEIVDIMDKDLGELESDYYDDDDDDYFMDDELYEVTCPSCGDVIYLNEEMLDEGSIDCPSCDELLEFDFDYDDDGDE